MLDETEWANMVKEQNNRGLFRVEPVTYGGIKIETN